MLRKILEVRTVEPKYPIAKKKLSMEYLRSYMHLRPRTNTISVVSGIRNALAYATHMFFHNHGFCYVHTPIITSDCEGFGEMFQFTILFSGADMLEHELKANPPPSEVNLEAIKFLVKEKGDKVSNLKANKADKAAIVAAVSELRKSKDQLLKIEEMSRLKSSIPQKDEKIDFSQDFFTHQAFLTVSGPLQVETYACALSSVYTFGPTFRAENSHTSRHLVEFWMVEPEIAFADLEDAMNYAKDYVKFLCQWLLENFFDDMEFMSKMFDKGAIDHLHSIANTPFACITYIEAV